MACSVAGLDKAVYNRCYAEGVSAGRAGTALDESGYPDDSHEFAAWLDGWKTTPAPLSRMKFELCHRQGKFAADSGREPINSGYADNTSEHAAWLEGYYSYDVRTE